MLCVGFLIELGVCLDGFAVRVDLSIPVFLFIYLINAKLWQLYLFAPVAILSALIAPSSEGIHRACVAAQGSILA